MKENINIPNFNDNGKYVMLYSIIKYDLFEEIILPKKLKKEILEHYKHINDLFKSYPKFDMYLFTKFFSYNIYLEANNFKTKDVNYENIDINPITYYIIKYLRKSWEISKDDLKLIHCLYSYNKKTQLTRNYIYKYYTRKFMKAIKNDDIKSRHYYDNKILIHLTFYENIEKGDF